MTNLRIAASSEPATNTSFTYPSFREIVTLAASIVTISDVTEPVRSDTSTSSPVLAYSGESKSVAAPLLVNVTAYLLPFIASSRISTTIEMRSSSCRSKSESKSYEQVETVVPMESVSYN